MQPTHTAARVLAAFVLLAQPALAAPVETILYAYASGEQGGNPTGLTADRNGNLYTPMTGLGLYGGVGRLVPAHLHGGKWHPHALFSFQSTDGSFPLGNALVGKGGNLFVTAFSGGIANLGTVVELTRPAKGTKFWTRTVLYNFPAGKVGWGPHGAAPTAGLIEDGHRNLFTTTSAGGRVGGGAVIELSPPVKGSSTWAERPIYSFLGGTQDGAGPETAPAFDQAGNLYVATSGGGIHQDGTVVLLSPPPKRHGAWAETILHSFTGKDGYLPQTTPILDAHGNVYVGTYQGGTGNAGTIVELTPPGAGKSNWTSNVLYTFGQAGAADGAAPDALLLDAAGNLFVTTYQGGTAGNGTLSELSPPAAGQSAWTETILYSFGAWPDAANPRGGMLADSSGNLYTATYEGGPDQFYGTIVQFSGTGFVVEGRK